jgi:adenylate cyclase
MRERRRANLPSQTAPLFSQRVYRLFSKHDSNTERAAASARKALTLDPDNAPACYILAITSAHLEDANTALGFARRGIELNSNFAPGYFALAMAHLYLGRTEEALVEVDQALRLSPSDPQSFAWRALRGSTLYLLGRYAEAAEAARESLGQRWFHTAWMQRRRPAKPLSEAAIADSVAPRRLN